MYNFFSIFSNSRIDSDYLKKIKNTISFNYQNLFWAVKGYIFIDALIFLCKSSTLFLILLPYLFSFL